MCCVLDYCLRLLLINNSRLYALICPFHCRVLFDSVLVPPLCLSSPSKKSLLSSALPVSSVQVMSDSTYSFNFDFFVCLVSVSSWLQHNLLQVTDLAEEEVHCCVVSLTIVLMADDSAVTFLCLGVLKKFQGGGTDMLCKL